MVRHSILIPVKEDDLSWLGQITAIFPAPLLPEPCHPIGTPGELWHHSSKTATLVGTPADKTGAPFHPAVKAVPTPKRLTAYIPHLRKRHRNQISAVPATSTFG